MTVGRGEVQLPWQRSLQIGLKELDLPAHAIHEGHVNPVPITLEHESKIGEQTTKIYVESFQNGV
jgi:hypothetical protein